MYVVATTATHGDLLEELKRKGFLLSFKEAAGWVMSLSVMLEDRP